MRRSSLLILVVSSVLLALLPAPSALANAVTETSDTLSVIKEGEAPTNTEIAITLSQSTPLTPRRVLIGRDDEFVDSMAAGALQGDSPLLLVPREGPVPAEVMTELDRLGAAQVTLLGGTAALEEAVETELSGAGYATERRAGNSRFETAIAIAEDAVAASGGSADTVILARAFAAEGATDPTQAFADSLAAGGMAAENGWPILLTQTDELSGPTAQWLGDNDVRTVLIMGGTAAIGQAVEDAVTGMGIATERLAGSDRFSTGVAVAGKLGAESAADVDRVTLVNAEGADAWAGGFAAAAHSAFYDAPIVLAAGEAVPPATAAWLEGGGFAQAPDGIRLTCVTPAGSCEEARVELDLPPVITVAFSPPTGSTIAAGSTVVIDTGGVSAEVVGGSCVEGATAPLPPDGRVQVTPSPAEPTCDLRLTLTLPGGVTQTEQATYAFGVIEVQPILVSADSAGNPVGGRLPDIAASGGGLAYVSNGDPTGQGAVGAWHVYAVRPQGQVLVDVDAGGAPSSGLPFASPQLRPRMTGDGTKVAFFSSDPSLDSGGRAGDGGGPAQLYLRDLDAGTTTLLSVDSAGNPVRSPDHGAVSDDGMVAAYAGEGANEDGSISRFIFLNDRTTGQVTTIPDINGDSYFNATALGLDVSADGRFVVFGSSSPTLLADDDNARTDVFIFERANASMKRVSKNDLAEQGNNDSAADQLVSVSADGRFVVFTSEATNLGGTGSTSPDVFQRDQVNDFTLLVSRRDAGDAQLEDAGLPDVSPGGQFVTFVSTNTPSGATPAGGCGVYRADTGSIPIRVDVAADGTANTNPSCASEFATVADTGAVAFTVFESLSPADTNRDYDVYLHPSPG